VSVWEIAVKYSLGKLPLPASPDRFIPNQRKRHGVIPLPLEEQAVLHLSKLPLLHRDPLIWKRPKTICIFEGQVVLMVKVDAGQ
jgi:PIN domain nuclease of toxin-antitoxin system